MAAVETATRVTASRRRSEERGGDGHAASLEIRGRQVRRPTSWTLRAIRCATMRARARQPAAPAAAAAVTLQLLPSQSCESASRWQASVRAPLAYVCMDAAWPHPSALAQRRAPCRPLRPARNFGQSRSQVRERRAAATTAAYTLIAAQVVVVVEKRAASARKNEDASACLRNSLLLCSSGGSAHTCCERAPTRRTASPAPAICTSALLA